MQKAFIVKSDVLDPIKKAALSVSEVKVIEGPACIIARLMRSEAEKLKGY